MVETAVRLILGTISLFTPWLNKFKALEELQFDHSRLLNLIGNILTLAAFWAVTFQWRHRIHLMLPFWTWILFTAISLGLSLGMARAGNKRVYAVLGAIFYLFAITSFIVGVSTLASLLSFKQLTGTVERPNANLYLFDAGKREMATTHADRSGFFQFLLETQESSDLAEIRAGVKERRDGNWQPIDWPEGSRKFVCDPLTAGD